MRLATGNHSLATAKVCYENYKKTHSDTENANAPARYAMVELENIHDKALEFSPIHRIVTETDEEALLEELQKTCCAPEWISSTMVYERAPRCSLFKSE